MNVSIEPSPFSGSVNFRQDHFEERRSYEAVMEGTKRALISTDTVTDEQSVHFVEADVFEESLEELDNLNSHSFREMSEEELRISFNRINMLTKVYGIRPPVRD